MTDIKFSDLGLSESIQQAIADAGYEKPTPIQAQVIPAILSGRDVFGCAQTGTGKTASFTLPMVQILSSGRARARMPRSVVLTPTRELAVQVSENFSVYSKHSKLKYALLIGGESIVEQERILNKDVDVLIATPGRLLDLQARGKILLTDIKILVLDEADRMLDMGFIPDVEKLVKLIPKKRLSLLFSATMPPEIKKLAHNILQDPIEIVVSSPKTTAVTISQFFVETVEKHKREVLRDILKSQEVKTAIIFCNRKKDASTVRHSLNRYGFHAAELHGDLTQAKRTQTLDEFKKGQMPILVASDVAARGIDVDNLSHVINFDVPQNPEDYIHRIGRTGRAGATGTAITLVTPENQKEWKAVIKGTNGNVTKLEIAIASSRPKQSHHDEDLPPLPNKKVVGFGDDIPAFMR